MTNQQMDPGIITTSLMEEKIVFSLCVHGAHPYAFEHVGPPEHFTTTTTATTSTTTTITA